MAPVGARRTRSAYVTKAEADVDTVHGPDAYLARLPDLHGVRGRLDVTQVVQIADNYFSRWLEIRAELDGRLFRIAVGFDRIGLAPDSRAEADEMYSRLAGKGI